MQDKIPQEQADQYNSVVLSNQALTVTWERFIPKKTQNDPASQKIFNIHFERYKTAARYVKGKRVLDIACGTGYGSQILCLAGAQTVVGVDVCPETVQYARQNYQEDNLEFVCADAEQFNWSEPFDVVVSFETIEHVPHPNKFLERIHHLLVPEGDLLLSAPLGETRHIDPYHLHAFSQGDVFALLKKARFSVDLYRCDDWFLSRADLLRWRQLYPSAKPALRVFATWRGWWILRDFIFRGGVSMPQLLVTARPNSTNLTSIYPE
ncbi:MAG: class I SAM-dependent methyltransferase [Cyanophyceae cyanobacterium]